MTLLATLYPNYDPTDFDLEISMETPKRLVITFADAIRWAEAELKEGRDESTKWERHDSESGRWVEWNTECNEHGATESWILAVEDVPFAKFED
jgi:hypothetical protein